MRRTAKRIDTLVTAMIEYGQRYLEIGMDEQMHADMMELAAVYV